METLTKYNIDERNHPIMTVVVHDVSEHPHQAHTASQYIYHRSLCTLQPVRLYI